MSRADVTTQKQLDEALADPEVDLIVIGTSRTWLKLTGSHRATVEAFGSATVRAFGSATVEAFGSATVEASPWVAIHRKSTACSITGEVIIDHTQINLTDPETWCRYHGVEVDDAGIATLYKAVNADWSTDRGFDYSPGATPSAPDWSLRATCGGGLHFSPTPAQAAGYLTRPAHFVAVGVEVASLVPLDADKCKAPRVVRPCVEVDRLGRPVVAVAS